MEETRQTPDDVETLDASADSALAAEETRSLTGDRSPSAKFQEIMHDAPLVSGSLWKAIWDMSWPLLFMTIGNSIVGLVDVQVAGMLGASAQAAVGLAEQVIFIFMIFLMSLGVGTTAIVSRATGRKDHGEADYATAQSLALSIIAGLILTVLAFFTAHFVLRGFSKAPEVISLADVYLTVFALYLVPFSLICIINAAFRAIGNARIPLLIVGTEILINIAGDYLTVVYQWPIRGLGVRGIALSAVVGAVFGSSLALYFLKRSQLKNSFSRVVPVSFPLIKRILDIGIPSAFQRLSWGLSVFGIFFILSLVAKPTAALAAWTVGMRVESLLFMPQMALSLAVSSIVGQNLGAKRVDRAFRAGWTVSGIAVGVIGALAVGMFVFARQLAVLMSAHDQATIDYTTTYLQINALSEPFLAVNSVLSGGLQGAGDTKIIMWISVISHWFLRIPLAWFLALHMGVGANGAWIAMTSSVIISTIAVAIRFQSGAWVHRRV